MSGILEALFKKIRVGSFSILNNISYFKVPDVFYPFEASFRSLFSFKSINLQLGPQTIINIVFIMDLREIVKYISISRQLGSNVGDNELC